MPHKSLTSYLLHICLQPDHVGCESACTKLWFASSTVDRALEFLIECDVCKLTWISTEHMFLPSAWAVWCWACFWDLQEISVWAVVNEWWKAWVTGSGILFNPGPDRKLVHHGSGNAYGCGYSCQSGNYQPLAISWQCQVPELINGVQEHLNWIISEPSFIALRINVTHIALSVMNWVPAEEVLRRRRSWIQAASYHVDPHRQKK